MRPIIPLASINNNDKIDLRWTLLPGGDWFPVFSMELEIIPPHLNGVYIIRASSKVLFVGYGSIRRQLEDHFKDAKLQVYRQQSIALYVTWAEAMPGEMESIAAFLTGILRPANYKKSNVTVKNRVNIPSFKRI